MDNSVMERYGFFYPENGKRFLASTSFATVKEAVEWFAAKYDTWRIIDDAPGDDETAFVEPNVGHIVVVRKIAK